MRLLVMTAVLALPALAVAATPNVATVDGIRQMQGDWPAAYEGAYGFRIENDRMIITAWHKNRPEMKVVKVLAEGIRITETRRLADTVVYRGVGATCYQSGANGSITAYSQNCAFTYTIKAEPFNNEHFQGFGVVYNYRPFTPR
jgi:hypothetical protein